MTSRIKQNLRYAQAEARWRNRVVWGTDNARERRMIRLDQRRHQLSIELDSIWGRMYRDGYNPKDQQATLAQFATEWQIIHSHMKEMDSISKRMARFEKETGKDVDALVSDHTQLNIKSVCF